MVKAVWSRRQDTEWGSEEQETGTQSVREETGSRGDSRRWGQKVEKPQISGKGCARREV